jgi:diacylglycerol kinase (ATP)
VIVAIVNPNSGNGKAAEAWARVKAFLPGNIETLETKRPAHAIDLTSSAIKAGAQTIVAVGGDGTINEVVNGFFEGEQEISPDARLAIIPYGTGSDFARILKLPRDEKKAAAVIHDGEARMVDLLKVLYTNADRSSSQRYSINVTSFGMGGVVAARVKRSYLFATLHTALKFRGNSITLTIDGTDSRAERILNVAVGNGQYHGGGMWACPRASIDDGFLDVTMIRYLSLFELLKGIPTLYNGAILTHPNVKAYRAKRVQATSNEMVLIEIDGEPVGRLPVDISIVPKAVRVLIP